MDSPLFFGLHSRLSEEYIDQFGSIRFRSISCWLFDFVSGETLAKVEKSDTRSVEPLIVEELNLALGDFAFNLDILIQYEGHFVGVEHSHGQESIFCVLFGIEVARDDPVL